MGIPLALSGDGGTAPWPCRLIITGALACCDTGSRGTSDWLPPPRAAIWPPAGSDMRLLACSCCSFSIIIICCCCCCRAKVRRDYRNTTRSLSKGRRAYLLLHGWLRLLRLRLRLLLLQLVGVHLRLALG